MKYYRVKYGYGKDNFISVNENELKIAIEAQGSGKVAVFEEGTVSGNHIISVTPDWNRELGIARDYELNGEDYDMIKNSTKREYQNLLRETNEQFLNGNTTKRIEG